VGRFHFVSILLSLWVCGAQSIAAGIHQSGADDDLSTGMVVGEAPRNVEEKGPKRLSLGEFKELLQFGLAEFRDAMCTPPVESGSVAGKLKEKILSDPQFLEKAYEISERFARRLTQGEPATVSSDRMRYLLAYRPKAFILEILSNFPELSEKNMKLDPGESQEVEFLVENLLDPGHAPDGFIKDNGGDKASDWYSFTYFRQKIYKLSTLNPRPAKLTDLENRYGKFQAGLEKLDSSKTPEILRKDQISTYPNNEIRDFAAWKDMHDLKIKLEQISREMGPDYFVTIESHDPDLDQFFVTSEAGVEERAKAGRNMIYVRRDAAKRSQGGHRMDRYTLTVGQYLKFLNSPTTHPSRPSSKDANCTETLFDFRALHTIFIGNDLFRSRQLKINAD
jgi:hypothetical protein